MCLMDFVIVLSTYVTFLTWFSLNFSAVSDATVEVVCGQPSPSADPSATPTEVVGTDTTEVIGTGATQVIGTGATEVVGTATDPSGTVSGDDEGGEEKVKKTRNRVKKNVLISKSGEELTFNHAMTFGLCNMNFTEKQKADIRDIGFGGLLEMKLKRLPSGIIPYLVSNFVHDVCVQKIVVDSEKRDSYQVSSMDVRDVFLLPRCVGNLISPSLDKKMKADFKKKFPCVGGKKSDYAFEGTYAAWLVYHMERMVDGGDDFKRLFVLYACACILSPNANHTVDHGLLPFLQDVDKIKDLDWCGYVLDRLGTGVDNFLNPKKGKKGISCSGCVLVLLIYYLHRYVYLTVLTVCITVLITIVVVLVLVFISSFKGSIY